MSHPFGDLFSQYLHRKHGLSQAKLAEGILQDPSIIGKMCKGDRLSGPQARARVCAIIDWLRQQAVLTTVDEANGLLTAAGMAPLRSEETGEARLLQQLRTPVPLPSLLAVPRSSVTTRPRTNLPAALTSFIGRTAAVGEVTQLIASRRLVTLTGAGGVGKTRLALETAKTLLARQAPAPFLDGIWFVDLTPLTDPQAIPQRILDLWRVPEQSERSPLETLLVYLSAKQTLLILDNCEHLIDACATLAETLLQHCPQLSLLATSREALNIGGETPWRVPSLTRPRREYGWEGQPPAVRPAFTPKTLADFEAVTLFVERAAVRQPGFALTATNAPAVAQICSRLDGIPLALEMAAARIHVFTVEEIAKRLDGAFDERFHLLTSGARTAPLRHQTLRATLEWSYALLTAQEQCLLVCLSVFSGGWTFAAAEEVTGCSLDQLAQLVNKSLVIADQQDGQTRYRLLETVRQFAYTQLVASEETQAIHERHVNFFVHWSEVAEPQLRGPQQAEWLNRVAREHDNLRGALQWTIPNGAEAGLRLAGALVWFWYARGHLGEGREWLERALITCRNPSAAIQAKALNAAGVLAWGQAAYATARLRFEACIALRPTVGNHVSIADALTNLAKILRDDGNHEGACTLFEESLTMFQLLDDQRGSAYPLFGLGSMAFGQGNYSLARSYYQEAIAILRKTGDQGTVARWLSRLAFIAWRQGDYALARSSNQETLCLGRKLEDGDLTSWALINLGYLACDEGNYEEASVALEEAHSYRCAVGDKRGIAIACNGLGEVAHRQGDVTIAYALYSESLTIRRAIGDKLGIAISLNNLGKLTSDQGDYDKAYTLLVQSLEVYHTLQDKPGIARTQCNLAEVLARQGEVVKATAFYQASLTTCWHLNARPDIAACFEGLARLAVAQYHLARAAHLLGAAATLRETIGMSLSPVDVDAHRHHLTIVRTQLNVETFEQAWEKGRTMTMGQAVEYVLIKQ